MYRIIGSDGKEYGPVEAEQIKKWLAEGRVNGRTQVRAEGSAEWRSLSQFPELTGGPTLHQSDQGMVSPSNSPSGSPSAAQQVSGPATGLIVTAIIGFVAQAGGFLINILGISGNFQGGSDAALNMFSGTIGIIFNFIGIAVGVLILLGALKMKRLESHNWAMASSIIALAPCISPCCLVGLPIGIWSLVVLARPDVKGAFTG